MTRRTSSGLSSRLDPLYGVPAEAAVVDIPPPRLGERESSFRDQDTPGLRLRAGGNRLRGQGGQSVQHVDDSSRSISPAYPCARRLLPATRGDRILQHRTSSRASHMSEIDLDVLLQEHRKFEPPPEFRARANVRSPEIYDRASADLERYWAEQADTLEWSTKYSKVLEWKAPHAK